MVKRIAIGLAVLCLAMGVVGRAHADAAPPAPAPGDSIQTGYIDTKVQMVSENVLITITDEYASVKATFQLRNQGTAEETFNVRFPVGAPDYWGGASTVVDFKAFVDGQPAAITMTNEPFPYHQEHELIPWANWPTTFPPGQTISLAVYYQVFPNTAFGGPAHMYDYILETGAGWFGTIGQGTITVRLPYDVNNYNIYEFYGDMTSAIEPASFTIAGTDLVWTFSDLEPTQADNIHVMILEPPIWREVLEARNQVELNPNNAESHARLGRAYRRVINLDRGDNCYCTGPRLQIANLAIAEYEAALAIDPDNVSMNVNYAELLVYVLAPKEKTLAAVARALELAPDDYFLKYAATRLDSMYARPTLSPEDIQNLQLTPSATISNPFSSLRMTDTPTGEPNVTANEATAVIVATNEPQIEQNPESVPTSPLSILGGIVAIGMGLGAFFWLRSRRADTG